MSENKEMCPICKKLSFLLRNCFTCFFWEHRNPNRCNSCKDYKKWLSMDISDEDYIAFCNQRIQFLTYRIEEVSRDYKEELKLWKERKKQREKINEVSEDE